MKDKKKKVFMELLVVKNLWLCVKILCMQIIGIR
jgi:hypothetical protein